MNHIDTMKLALEALELNRRTHYYCEDTWYSCPKHEDGCANEAEGDECNCGADQINAQIDNAITALREALAEQQEPVAWTNWRELVSTRHYRTTGWEMYADKRNPDDVAIYTSPPASKPWAGLTPEQRATIAEANNMLVDDDLFDAIEAKLKERNT